MILLFITNCYGGENKTKIYCPECHRHIYTFIGEIPLTLKTTDINDKNLKGYKKRDNLICRFDKAPLNGWEYWFWKRDLPPPKLVYPALTVMIKKNKEFIWFPYEVNISDN